ncbi:MAG: hypothetical protein AVDCRST_MAG91-2478 [uncultured Sphingomonadaceae bacterium]|uniref:PIN domain-containing protein n=1 Tax=uncultured Sphingomonadaceae bacterium TaxID=169976 RepID=A0A6J4TJC0_9SPHN|nr:MAG: hypothetical protein AVDCRST_MAG91-2478 [uncultured Sphingomonadaceae bacterium]
MSEPFFVLDASALLALLHDEPGAREVKAVLAASRMSAVNWSEVAARLIDLGLDREQVEADMSGFGVEVVAFDRSQAQTAGSLRRITRAAGLSLGDRACLALALREGAMAVTADRAWAKLDVGVEVRLIR